MQGWVSVIPTDMFNGWVKKKYVGKDCVHLTSTVEKTPYSAWIMYKEINKKHVDEKTGKESYWTTSDSKPARSKSESKRLVEQGFKKGHIVYYVPEKQYKKMRNQVGVWYDKVFDYVTKWLTKNGYIKLKKGSFDGGFCAVTTEDQTTSGWGAPLAEEENKVVQIKEKFGDIRVYFTSLTKEESKQIKQFEKDVEKKFDCRTCFC